MKIYTEVVYYWDDAKGELVKESEKSFDYNGPMTLAEPLTIAAGVIASIQLGANLYGLWKGQKADEKELEERKRLNAQREALAIKQYEHSEGKALGQIATLQNVVGSEIDDAETEMLFEAAVVSKRKSSTFAAQNLMKGQSTTFAINRSFGDDLRKVQKGATQLKKKRADVLYKIESVEQDLKDQYLNMEAQIAGLASLGGNDRSAMYLNMVNGGLQSIDTFYKYQKYFTKPETPTTTTMTSASHTSTNTGVGPTWSNVGVN